MAEEEEFRPSSPSPEEQQWRAEEREWRADQKLLLQDQINISRKLNRLTCWAVIITAIPAFLGLASLFFIWETLKATKIQADAAKTQATAAEASVKIATESVDETVTNFQLDQRAWVGPIEVPATTIIPGMVRFNVFFVNSGKTPARKLQAFMSGRFMSTKDKFSPVYDRVESIPSAAIIHPGMRVRFPSTDMPFTQERIEAIKSGDLTFYLFGKFSYEDIFRKKREGTFCIYMRRIFETTFWCPTYNDNN